MRKAKDVRSIGDLGVGGIEGGCGVLALWTWVERKRREWRDEGTKGEGWRENGPMCERQR
jgi:hypothetical protein